MFQMHSSETLYCFEYSISRSGTSVFLMIPEWMPVLLSVALADRASVGIEVTLKRHSKGGSGLVSKHGEREGAPVQQND